MVYSDKQNVTIGERPRANTLEVVRPSIPNAAKPQPRRRRFDFFVSNIYVSRADAADKEATPNMGSQLNQVLKTWATPSCLPASRRFARLAPHSARRHAGRLCQSLQAALAASRVLPRTGVSFIRTAVASLFSQLGKPTRHFKDKRAHRQLIQSCGYRIQIIGSGVAGRKEGDSRRFDAATSAC